MRTFLRYPGGLEKVFTMSYDDGVYEDERFIKICDENGIKSTFNFNTLDFTIPNPSEGHFCNFDDVKKIYKNHEIALHGHTHSFFELMRDDNLLYEILENRRVLEAGLGKPVYGLALPWGTYSSHTVEIMRTAGVAYSRTTRSTGSFSMPMDWLEWHPTCHHADGAIDSIADKFINSKPTNDLYVRTPWLFFVWGHTYEFAGGDRWDRIARFCEKVGNRSDVWYATNIELYEYTMAYKNLRFSLDGFSVYNPSACDVFFEWRDDANFKFLRCKIGAGETAGIDSISF